MSSSVPARRVQPVLWLLGVALLAGLAAGGLYPCRVLLAQASAPPAVRPVGATQAAPGRAASRVTAEAITASAPLLQPLPMVRTDEAPGRVAFYFFGDQVQLPANANKALVTVIRGVAAGQSVVIRGHAAVDTRAALTTQRVLAVHNLLVSLGIGEDKIRRARSRATPLDDAGAPAPDHVDVVLDGD